MIMTLTLKKHMKCILTYGDVKMNSFLILKRIHMLKDVIQKRRFISMSTRSYICIENEDKSISGIYCHSDGYLTYNGAMLLDHYSDRKKLKS